MDEIPEEVRNLNYLSGKERRKKVEMTLVINNKNIEYKTIITLY